MRNILTSALLCSLVAAFPAERFCKTFDDNFDAITVDPLLPQLNKIPPQNGLVYTGWVAVEADDDLHLKAHSPPNLAATSIVQDLLQLGQVTLSPYGIISVGPGVASFDARSFYFGCVADAHESAAELAVGCVVTAKGFTAHSELPEATFSFAPTTPLGATMALAELPESYVDLHNLTLGLAVVDGLDSQTVLQIDDFVHCNNH